MAGQPWLPATWHRRADVVVIGFGAAGAATAITAYDEGAQVILLDKAPQGHEGGNTRVAGQGYLNTSAVDKAVAYLHALCGPYRVPDPMGGPQEAHHRAAMLIHEAVRTIVDVIAPSRVPVR